MRFYTKTHALVLFTLIVMLITQSFWQTIYAQEKTLEIYGFEEPVPISHVIKTVKYLKFINCSEKFEEFERFKKISPHANLLKIFTNSNGEFVFNTAYLKDPEYQNLVKSFEPENTTLYLLKDGLVIDDKVFTEYPEEFSKQIVCKLGFFPTEETQNKPNKANRGNFFDDFLNFCTLNKDTLEQEINAFPTPEEYNYDI